MEAHTTSGMRSHLILFFLLPAMLTSVQVVGDGVRSLAPAINTSGVSAAYEEPAWLQHVPWEAGVAKYRKRRFLTFLPGSSLTVTLEFEIPVLGIGSSSTFVIEHEIVFDLPTSSNNYFFGRSFPGRDDRIDFYSRFEKFLAGFDLDGHACALRAVCEIAEMPFEHGLLGELINLVFSIMAFSDSGGPYDEYSTAEYYGRFHGDCAALYPGCAASVIGYISKVI